MYSARYSVISLSIDEARDLSVPVGVALWSTDERFADFRLMKQKERLAGVSRDLIPMVELERMRLNQWLHQGSLPYAQEEVRPWSDAFWLHLRNLLVHRVRVSEPRAIEVSDARTDLDAVYESIVSPHRTSRASSQRIDYEIGKCLGDLASCFATRDTLPGYKERAVKVMRLYRGKARKVIVEGLNLASDPDQHADQLLGKLMRLAEANAGVQVVVGYLPSPHGLNGETPLVEYIQQRTNAQAFDLLRQKRELVEATRMLINHAGPLDSEELAKTVAYERLVYGEHSPSPSGYADHALAYMIGDKDAETDALVIQEPRKPAALPESVGPAKGDRKRHRKRHTR